MMIDIEKYNWDQLDENKKQCEQIRKDISTARGIINDALLRYKKKKLGARNKKQAADMALMFAELNEYNSENDIRDAYGWKIITEKEMDRLMDLWQKREKYVKESGEFEDRVTNLVQIAMNGIGGEYIDFLNETDEADRLCRERALQIEKDNIRRDYERKRGWRV